MDRCGHPRRRGSPYSGEASDASEDDGFILPYISRRAARRAWASIFSFALRSLRSFFLASMAACPEAMYSRRAASAASALAIRAASFSVGALFAHGLKLRLAAGVAVDKVGVDHGGLRLHLRQQGFFGVGGGGQPVGEAGILGFVACVSVNGWTEASASAVQRPDRKSGCGSKAPGPAISFPAAPESKVFPKRGGLYHERSRLSPPRRQGKRPCTFSASCGVTNGSRSAYRRRPERIWSIKA